MNARTVKYPVTVRMTAGQVDEIISVTTGDLNRLFVTIAQVFNWEDRGGVYDIMDASRVTFISEDKP